MRRLLCGLLALLSACTANREIARVPGVQTADAAPLEVFRTVQVETPAHRDTVTALAVDRAETLLLTGSADKSARLWNLADGAPRGVLRPPIGEGDLGRIDAVALSPDGRIAAVGGRTAGPTEDAVLLFDTRSQRLIGRLERTGATRAGDTVARLAFSDDATRLIARYAPGGATAQFDVQRQVAVREPPTRIEPGPGPTTLTLAAGRRVSADAAGRIAVDEAGGRTLWQVAPAALAIDCLDAPADGAAVRIAGAGTTRLFSVARMAFVRRPAEVGTCRGAATPLRLGDGSLVSVDRGRLTRMAAGGRAMWVAASSYRIKALAASGDGTAIVAALGDGTLRWLDAATGAERLALYLHPKGGWIAWTPDGFFDHSEEAWNFAGWHVNRGPRREAEFVKLGQLYDVAYRPDLIRLAYAGRAAAAEAVRLGDAVDPRSRLAGGLPPRVAITLTPAPDRRTALVEARVEERGGGIGKLLYRVNGAVVGIDPAPAAIAPGTAATLSARRTVPLRNGPSQIEVVALDGAGELESAAAMASIADGRAEVKQGKLWAVVVGINGYANPDLRLTYARPDAEAIAALLPKRGGSAFTATNVVALYDADATTANIAQTIATMAGSMAETDTFVLYLSGHGINLRGRYRYITYDVTAADMAQLEARSLTQEKLQDLLATVPAGSAIVLLDTCYSGRAVTLGDADMLIRSADRRLSRATGRSVLAAATDQQAALEGYNGHGVLTWVLLEGLNGKAAPDAEAITTRALADYAVAQVPVITAREFEAEQLPVFSAVGQDIVLARRRAR